ncbi:MAG: peptidase C69, partial [Synergistaceae bacterium]
IDFNDKANFAYSSNIKTMAKKLGRWKEGEKFVFYKVYGPEAEGRSPYLSQRREWRASSMLTPSAKLPKIRRHTTLFS